MSAGCSCEEAFLKATGAQVTSQGTLKAKSQLVDVYGEKITHCESHVRVGECEMSNPEC